MRSIKIYRLGERRDVLRRLDQGIEFTARDAQIWCIEMGLQ
jgi:hypothetical protein